MERIIPNFNSQYQIFRLNFESINVQIIEAENIQIRTRLKHIKTSLNTLDVKMRLAFGIREIILNDDFVSPKQNDLKQCHLLYYKLADLWFAYDAYLKFFEKTIGSTKNSIDWIDAIVHNNYSSKAEITFAKNSINQKFEDLYTDNTKRNLFVNYLNYCKITASNSQIKRLDQVILKIEGQTYDLKNSEILTIIYAIRNNFVHNGETTVVPDNFGFANKTRLLTPLYSYLAIIILVSSNITYSRI